MNRARFLAATALAALSALGLAALSQVPYSFADTDTSTLRLSWRARSMSRTQCRVPTPEELANVPVHMRRTEICDALPIPYRIEVVVDDRTLIDKSIVTGGTRADRPIYVFEELKVASGEHDVGVRFYGEHNAVPDTTQSDAIDAHFSDRLYFAAGGVVLLTYDETTSRLTRR